MGRPKAAKRELGSLAECNTALAELRDAKAELAVLTAERNLAIAAASARFEEWVDAAKAAVAEAEAGLKQYYYGHVSEIEKDGAKHVQLSNGKFGRRDNPEALKPLNKKWTWDAIKNAVRAKFGTLYFHPAKEPEIDREKLKAAKLAVEELRQLGLKIEADETFYAEPLEVRA